MAFLFLLLGFGGYCTQLSKLQKISFERPETERPQANKFAWVKLMRRFSGCHDSNRINPLCRALNRSCAVSCFIAPTTLSV
ncbi:MAG: hypothetical protein BA864_12990 [Desulfuromonadales bacterium C00003093]|nr:MAG: hypothetical protein BA864_12990 [Desulfuromonadales bacterium C00003093]